MPTATDLDILLVGKTGHGKSSTGNSIFKKDVFDWAGNTTSMTYKIESYSKMMDGRNIFIVDTPGLCDTRDEDSYESYEKALENFTNALCRSYEGFHAIILVFKYGVKMTKEEVDAIQELKGLLGKDVLREHGVLLMTNGDTFKHDMERKNLEKSFDEWCKEQKGYMQDVLRECQHRCILFNNIDKNMFDRQRIELITMIDTMKDGQRYTEGIFKKIREEWRTGTRLQARKTYLNSATIFFDLVGLVRDRRIDQNTVDKMRIKVNELKIAMNQVEGDDKKKASEQVEKAEKELGRLEKAVQSSPNGIVEDHPAVEVFVTAINGVLNILAAPFFIAAGVVSMVVIGVFKGIVEGAKFVGKGMSAAKNRCVLQ